MKLALIYSGGTIGCAGTPLKPLPVKEFQALWGRHAAARFDDILAVDWQWLAPALDSSDMTPADWGKLAGMVLDAREEQAVLLLHGTDTMAWTAAALAFLLTLYDPKGRPVGRFGMPVVLTGSQRPLFDDDGIRPGTDALDNLRTAIDACGTRRPEVTVAFGGEILPGARVMKISTSADRAFGCPKGEAPCPELPVAQAGVLLAQLDQLALHLGKRAVVSVTPNPAGDNLVRDQVEAVVDKLGDKLGAIYLNGYGIGNFPAKDSLAPTLRSAHKRGILIVTGSQVLHGDVDPSTYGAGHWLGECGAIPSADMTAPAAHAKLHVAMALGAANGWNQAETERFFLAPIAGEIRGGFGRASGLEPAPAPAAASSAAWRQSK
jgi:L-asparaginase